MAKVAIGTSTAPPSHFHRRERVVSFCRLAGVAVSELVAIDADGRSRCFGCLFAFPWAAAQHDRAASLRGTPRPRPLWGAAAHPAAGSFCSADIQSATWDSVHMKVLFIGHLGPEIVGAGRLADLSACRGGVSYTT